MTGCNPLYLHGILIIILMLGTEVRRGWGGSTSSPQVPHMRLPAVQLPVVLGLVPVHEADPPPAREGGEEGPLIVRSSVSHDSHHSHFLGERVRQCVDVFPQSVRL